MVGGLVTESKIITFFATNPNFNRQVSDYVRDLDEGWYFDYCETQPVASVLIWVQKNDNKQKPDC